MFFTCTSNTINICEVDSRLKHAITYTHTYYVNVVDSTKVSLHMKTKAYIPKKQ